MSTTEQRLAEYEKLYKKAQGYDPNAFQNDFKKAYGEANNYNADLINQQSQALGELQSVAPTLREQYSNSLITDPTKQMALIAQARQIPIANLGNAAGLLEARGNKYADILGKALGGYQTSAQQANTAAENAWRLYQDAVQQSQFNRSNKTPPSNKGFIDLINSILEGEETKTNPREQIQTAINNIKSLRQTSNIEANMNQYYSDILKRASGLGLNLNPEGLWVALGNERKQPMNYNLFL